MKTCVCLPNVESLFPPVLWSSCSQTSLAFNAKCSRGSSSQCQTSKAGKPNMGLRTLTPVGELLWYSYFPVCASPVVYGNAYIMKAPLRTSWCDFFVFGCIISFSVAFGLLLMVVQQLVVILGFRFFHDIRWAQVLRLHHLVSIKTVFSIVVLRKLDSSKRFCINKVMHLDSSPNAVQAVGVDHK